jgi:hypothetical protein
MVLTSLPLGKIIATYPKFTLCKTYSKIASNNYLKSKFFVFQIIIAKYLSHIHTLLLKKDKKTKLKSAAKFVKGLPLLRPCHQPNPRKGLITYMR